MAVFKYFTETDTRKAVYSNMQMQLLDKNGAPFDVRKSDFEGIQLNFKMSSSDTDTPYNIQTIAKNPDFEVLMPSMLILAAVISSLMFINSMYKIYTPEEMFFMAKASYMSVSILTVANFQFFGVFMVLGLNYAPQYFQYLTIAGVNCFLCSIITNKMSYYFFMTQHANHPMINANGWASPRVRFYILLIVAELIFYIAGFVMVRYPAYAWYCAVFYLYPLFHVVSTVIKSNRNCFRW